MNLTKMMRIGLVLLGISCAQTVRADYYVAQNLQTPSSPYTNWTTAASNIQDAVEVAVHGDTIWIGPGEYTASATPPLALFNTNVVFTDNKALNFRGSTGNPADVIVNGEGKYRAFAASRTSGGTLGFTFDSLTISNCVTTNIYNGGSAIFFNTGSRSSTSTVQNCVFTHNSALRGGAIHWQPKNANRPGLIISNSVFRNNQASGSASAVWTFNAFNLYVLDCVFENNQAERTTLSTRYANTLIDRCVFTDNESVYGVISLGECRDAIVRNTLFSGNTTTENGVMVVNNDGVLDVQNCTIVSNDVGSHGAIRIYPGSGMVITARVVNSVLYFNADQNFSVYRRVDREAYLYVTNSCLSDTNGLPNFYADGNITNDPKFVNFDACDFRLANGSPCLDAGTNLPWTADAIDLDGNPRRDTVFGLVDMGAYEHLYRGTLILVQ